MLCKDCIVINDEPFTPPSNYFVPTTAKVGDDPKVVIEGTTTQYWSVHPCSDTKLVLDERAILLGQIDLTTLNCPRLQVGMCIRITYNGVIVAGLKFTELHIKVQGLAMM